MYSQSRIGIGDSKSKDAQKKVAAHRHFLLHWLSFLCQRGRHYWSYCIHREHLFEPNPERTEWICFPGSQIYESSIFFSFFLYKTCSTRKPPKEEEEAEIE
jgi:hypothetical protein